MKISRIWAYIQRNRALAIVVCTIFILIVLNLWWVPDQNLADVAKSIVVTGLPSLLMLTLVTVLVEYSIRKKERKELRNFIRAE
ncbi:hypothetical protein CGG93_24905, partial [Vibrio parahaemolyticus]